MAGEGWRSVRATSRMMKWGGLMQVRSGSPTGYGPSGNKPEVMRPPFLPLQGGLLTICTCEWL